MSTLEFPDYPEEYIHYLAEYYGSRDYFECHEIMEEYWKEQQQSPYTMAWLVLIRIPVSLYHARRGNWAGAIKLMGKAAEEADARLFDRLGLDGERLVDNIKKTAHEWTLEGARYADFELLIRDEQLLKAAQARSQELGYKWGLQGLDAGENVINRHRTRDRSEVVNARAEAAKRRALSRVTPTPSKDSRQ
jgi:predicted metal-dependent hydrolase